MNEQQFAERLRNLLDESGERVSYRVAHRLEVTRRAALARAPRAESRLAGEMPGSAQYDLDDGTARRWTRTAAVLSLMVLIAGLVALSIWSDLERADETADVDMAVLTDEDVPISGYADRGFGVFLKNTHQ